ncbi:MAG: YigZ family protein [Bacilli bacterium]|nr:YigZ family protein [Bacilli bacterium]
MKTIRENVKSEFTINKSIFISELIKVKDVSNVPLILDDIKKKYKDATHYCYAYIIDDYKKSSDDNEPGGTAGVPIMDTLNKKELNYVLCVVIRYFGGIKLGAGGLIRAYRKASSDVINLANLCDLVNGYEVVIEVSYDKQKELDYYLKCDYKKEFQENVRYYISCDKSTLSYLENNYHIISKKEKIIEV